MSHNQTTRFGADPLLDQELATKKYVDDNAGGTNSVYLGASFTTTYTGVADDRFLGMFVAGNLDGFANDSNKEMTLREQMTLTDVEVNINFNTRGTDCTLAFRDDGVSLGTVTIAANTTGHFETTGLSDIVAADSMLIFLAVVNDTSGNFRILSCICRLES